MELRLRKFGDSETFIPADPETAEKVGKLADVIVVARVKDGRRSLDQNDLYQVWAREIAADKFFHKQPKEVTEAEHEATKYTLQRNCYIDTSWPFLVTKNRDLIGGGEKPGLRSTAKMGRGEMHQYLNWVQAWAASNGLILEAKGEYAELREAQNG